jgi:oligopeptidase B
MAPQHPHVHTEHGVERPDPYFWLKDKTSAESLAYLSAERAYYQQEVAPLADLTAKLREEMTGRVAAETESARWREGEFDYFTRTLPGLEYDQLCRADKAGAVRLLLDENALLGDSTYVGIGLRLVSPDGAVLAYSYDTAGDEVYRLRFRDLLTGSDLPDQVDRTYYGGAWSKDSSTFFYVVHDELYRPFQVWRHTVGTDADVLVYEELDPQFDLTVWSDRAGDYIVIHTANRNTSEVWLVPTDEPTTRARLVSKRRPGIEYSVGHLPGSSGGELLIVTNDGAEEFRLVRATMAEPDADHWVEVVAAQPHERIHDVEVFAGHVVLTVVREGRQLLRILPRAALALTDPLQDSVIVDAGVPGGLLTLGHNEEFDVDHILIEVESYVEPLTWHTVDLASGSRELVKRTPVPNYDASEYVLEERWVEARDGARIPVRLVRSKGTALNGTAPLLLYGYGAYESSFWPGFETWLPSLLDRGVVFVHAGIRGGGEMGRRWWVDGRLMRKLNTFTDFIDVADQLAKQGLVDGGRIVSRGLSAGGLLQGAVFSLRPDRWRAVVAEVPFVDVLTTMFDLEIPLSAGELDEWGDPRRREDFDYLRSYSPYEIVPEGVRPDLLVTGALHDPRVMVHEPAKWVAKLRSSDNGSAGRVLFRVETGEGGHVGPTGRYAQLGYEAEVVAYILDAVGSA